MTQTVLIAGASGRFGAQVKIAFNAAGWEVRVFDRHTHSMMEASVGADVIVNALNPPNYKNWAETIPKITKEVIEAAKANGATVLIPGNVYNYGTQPAPWSDQTPQVASSRKGQIRIDMEALYRASGVPTIILRSGDFIDDGATGTWLDLVMLKSLPKGKLTYMGNPDIPHAWGYLPDLARAAVGLVEKRDQLGVFCDVAFPGYTISGNEMRAVLEELSGRPLNMVQLPWWAFRIASPFWALGRELLEMRYLWDHPHWLDGTKFDDLLPDFETTGVQEALASALPVDFHPNKPVVGTQRLARAQ